MHKLLCFHLYVCMCVEYAWEGLKHVSWMSFLCFFFNVEGILWGFFWHYSPLDREEVAMYEGRY